LDPVLAKVQAKNIYDSLVKENISQQWRWMVS
jgi:ABC-type Zn uptake system ZnuABC Zn-binding protein ZnuA